MSQVEVIVAVVIDHYDYYDYQLRGVNRYFNYDT